MRRRTPRVLDRSEVAALLNAVESPRYRAILMLIYGAGLRVGEVVRLRPDDVDAGLPEQMLERLRGSPDGEIVAMETERGLLLSRSGPDVEEFLEDVDAIRREYREALRKLAE